MTFGQAMSHAYRSNFAELRTCLAPSALHAFHAMTVVTPNYSCRVERCELSHRCSSAHCAQVIRKTQTAPKCQGYVFTLDDGRYLDPTDERGEVSERPGATLRISDSPPLA